MTNATGYLFPVFAENAIGMPVMTVGLLSTFAALVTWGVAWAYGRYGSRLRNKRPPMLAGASTMVLSAWLLASIAPDVPPSSLLPALIGKGAFGALFLLPVAGFTFRDLGEERFAPGYQSKNLMRQLAASFSTAIASIALMDLQFAKSVQLSGAMSASTTSAWLDSLAADFGSRGMAAQQAHAAALGVVQRLLDQQSLLLACDDLYRVLAVLGVLMLVLVVVQRRLK
jgi:hypothetical protein